MGRKPRKTFAQKPRRFARARASASPSSRAASPSPAVTLPPSSSWRSRPCCREYLRRPSAPSGAQRFMEPKQIMRPRGMEPMSVTAKSFSVATKPSFRAKSTVWNSDMGLHLSYPRQKQRTQKRSLLWLFI